MGNPPTQGISARMTLRAALAVVAALAVLALLLRNRAIRVAECGSDLCWPCGK
ncbi:hypothetical protein GCM10029976_012580 [Kribbella albertanoniae]